MIHTIVVQTLESSYDDGAIAGFIESSIALTNGQTSVTIDRAAHAATSNIWSFDFIQIENLVDANPTIPGLILTARSQTSATYQLSPQPDSANYVLRYRYPTVI